jgi:hypothetical protein
MEYVVEIVDWGGNHSCQWEEYYGYIEKHRRVLAKKNKMKRRILAGIRREDLLEDPVGCFFLQGGVEFV